MGERFSTAAAVGAGSYATAMNAAAPTSLVRYAWLSVVAAVATISLKLGAWWFTGSLALASDAAESVVNLAAALVAVYTLKVAARPADTKYLFGRGKAEFFSAAFEGALILIAALLIIVAAVERLLNPAPVDQTGIGVAIAVVAAAINGAVAWVLFGAAAKYRSAALRADAHHLMTDVWTSVGVIVGVIVVGVTGWDRLDAIAALVVGCNIVRMGWELLRDSADGLLDVTWPEADNTRLAARLAQFQQPQQVVMHALRTRESGQRRFAEVHLLVPGEWTVRRAHDLAEEIEQAVQAEFEGASMLCHIEPIEDPNAYDDYEAELVLPTSTVCAQELLPRWRDEHRRR